MPKSIVMVSPAGRGVNPGQRPIFVVAINNLTNAPMNFSVGGIEVIQTKGGAYAKRLQVKTYEQLVKEEQTKQVVTALLVGTAAAANAYNASQAGYGTATVNTYGRYGSTTSHVSYYSPTANAVAQANASAQNHAMIASTIEQGRANLGALEQFVIKDNTLLPGEWYGGQLHFEAPNDAFADGKVKSYSMGIRVGDEQHVIEVTQQPGA
jgi:hypothetical protein